MARMLGIPARVAVGFLAAGPVGPGRPWEYSSHDLHAWPELFFAGCRLGALRADPGAAGPGSVPAYTTQQVPVGTPTGGAATAAAARPAGPRPGPPAPPAPARRPCRRHRRPPRRAGLPVAAVRRRRRGRPRGGRCCCRPVALRRRRRERAPGRRPRGRVGRAAGHRDRPRRAVAGRTLTAGDRHRAGGPLRGAASTRTPRRGRRAATGRRPRRGARPGPAGPRAGAGALRPGRRAGRRAPAARARRDRGPASRRCPAARPAAPGGAPSGGRGRCCPLATPRLASRRRGAGAVRRRGRPRRPACSSRRHLQVRR